MGPGSYGGNPKTKLGPVWREDSRWCVRLKVRLDMGGVNRWDVESSSRIVQHGVLEFLQITASEDVKDGGKKSGKLS